MGLWNTYGAPAFVSCACASKPITRHRKAVVPNASGRVLEIGCGAGQNFEFYDREKVTELMALEPDPEMMKRARKREADLNGIPVNFLAEGGDGTSVETGSVDTVLFTFVLCTIPDWVSALTDARRVLKPGGQVIFCEHGLAPDDNINRWQRRIEPVWKRIGGGCHLTRNPRQMLSNHGFTINECTADYTRNMPKFAGFVSHGRASVAS